MFGLTNRAVVGLSGVECQHFLQGLISNDVRKLESQPCIYAFILSPQGRFLFDLFIYKAEDGYLLDCPSSTKGELIKKLKLYKLKSQVSILDFANEYSVVIDDVDGYADPRNASLGKRSIIKKNIPSDDEQFLSYQIRRIECLCPDAELDFFYDKSLPLDYGANELNAVDYKKGCYVGQEVTARMQHRGAIRKRLLKFEYHEQPPIKGEELLQDGKKVGIALGSVGNVGLVQIKVEDFNPDAPVSYASSQIKPG